MATPPRLRRGCSFSGPLPLGTNQHCPTIQPALRHQHGSRPRHDAPVPAPCFAASRQPQMERWSGFAPLRPPVPLSVPRTHENGAATGGPASRRCSPRSGEQQLVASMRTGATPCRSRLSSMVFADGKQDCVLPIPRRAPNDRPAPTIGSAEPAQEG